MSIGRDRYERKMTLPGGPNHPEQPISSSPPTHVVPNHVTVWKEVVLGDSSQTLDWVD